MHKINGNWFSTLLEEFREKDNNKYYIGKASRKINE